MAKTHTDSFDDSEQFETPSASIASNINAAKTSKRSEGNKAHSNGQAVKAVNSLTRLQAAGLFFAFVAIFLATIFIERKIYKSNELSELEQSEQQQRQSVLLESLQDKLNGNKQLQAKESCDVNEKNLCKSLHVFSKDLPADNDKQAAASSPELKTVSEPEPSDAKAKTIKAVNKAKRPKVRPPLRKRLNARNFQKALHQNKSMRGNKVLKKPESAIAKKNVPADKKNSTAEPIIYLFAFVIIYLLLKAISDINTHYKTHNKNDKRLRRCSLQSYAQHRPERRASKGIQSKYLPTIPDL